MSNGYAHMNPQGINIIFAGGAWEADDFAGINLRKHLITYFSKPDVDMRCWEKFGKENPDDHYFLILDSGAFSAWNSGVEVNIDNLIEYMHKWKHVYTIAANLDKIPGVRRQAPTKADVDLAAKVGYDNSKYILSKGIPQDKLMPIFHQGEDFVWLERMVGDGFRYIGISPSNDYTTEQRMFWLDDVYDYLTKQPSWYIKTHAYGMTSERLMTTYPTYTADSTSWVLQAGFGMIATPWRNISMSDDPNNFEKNDCYHTLPPSEKKMVDDYIEKMGFDKDKLIRWEVPVIVKGQEIMKDKSYMVRRKFNVKYLLQWEKSYKYQPKPFREVNDIFDLVDDKPKSGLVQVEKPKIIRKVV